MNLVVFDIDGTLVNTEAFEDELYSQAVRTVLGIEIDADWSHYSHATDSGILNEVLERHKPNAPGSLVQARVRKVFTDLVAEYVVTRGGRLPEIPGAVDFVNRLKKHPAVQVAVATGGWRETALIKLRAIGLHVGCLPVATSSDALSKVDILLSAERRALPNGGAIRKTYFGDSDYDREVSQQLGYGFVAIGSKIEHRPRYSDFGKMASILYDLGL